MFEDGYDESKDNTPQHAAFQRDWYSYNQNRYAEAESLAEPMRTEALDELEEDRLATLADIRSGDNTPNGRMHQAIVYKLGRNRPAEADWPVGETP